MKRLKPGMLFKFPDTVYFLGARVACQGLAKPQLAEDQVMVATMVGCGEDTTGVKVSSWGKTNQLQAIGFGYVDMKTVFLHCGQSGHWRESLLKSQKSGTSYYCS